jgi:50S ribosomal subunit-associated GTPase HflX
MNKMDRLPADAQPEDILRRLEDSEAAKPCVRSVALSALTGMGIDVLERVIDEVLAFDPMVRVRFRFPLSEAASISALHSQGRVLDIQYSETACELEAEVPASLKHKLARFVS